MLKSTKFIASLKQTLMLLWYSGFLLLVTFTGFVLVKYLTYYFTVPESKLACLLTHREKSIDPSAFVNAELLRKKIELGLPLWAKQQIQDDLEKFSNVSAAQLDRIVAENPKNNNLLTRVQIKDKKVSTTFCFDSAGIENLLGYIHGHNIIKSTLEYLAKEGYLEDTDFIISLSDFVVLQGDKSVPVFTFAKNLTIPLEKDTILFPDWQNLASRTSMSNRIRTANQQVTWDAKKNILFWRGGQFDSNGFRKKFVEFSIKHQDKIDAEFIKTYGDVSTNFVEPEVHLNYKYLISLDGIRASWERFIWHLHSNSLVFKQESPDVQWFYKGVQPYVHYVPITDEGSILSQMHWADTHPTEVQLMIENSTDFVEKNLALEDMFHYIIVLFQEYNKKLVQ